MSPKKRLGRGLDALLSKPAAEKKAPAEETPKAEKKTTKRKTTKKTTGEKAPVAEDKEEKYATAQEGEVPQES